MNQDDAVDALLVLFLLIGLTFMGAAMWLWIDASMRRLPPSCMCGLFPLPAWADGGDTVSVAYLDVLHTSGGCWERSGDAVRLAGPEPGAGEEVRAGVPAPPDAAAGRPAAAGAALDGGGGVPGEGPGDVVPDGLGVRGGDPGVPVLPGGGGLPDARDAAAPGRPGGRGVGGPADVAGDPLAGTGNGFAGPARGVLLIWADRLITAAQLERARSWESSGRSWFHQGLGYWVLAVDLPQQARDALISAGWPPAAVEVGGR